MFLENGFWTVELWNKRATLIRRCLQALAEVLKSNKSITTIDLEYNQIWAEGA